MAISLETRALNDYIYILATEGLPRLGATHLVDWRKVTTDVRNSMPKKIVAYGYMIGVKR